MKTSATLEKFTFSIKTEILNYLEKKGQQRSNISTTEREILKSLPSNNDITIQKADKDGKVAVMKTTDYINVDIDHFENEIFWKNWSMTKTLETQKCLKR